MSHRHAVLIIGCGNIAGGFDANRPPDALPLSHAGAFAANPHFRIAACVEPDAERRAAFMARWQVLQGAASLAEISGRFDLVSICSPTALHADHLGAALALGPRLVFCEKPVSPTVAETETLVRRCRDDGVLLAVNHNRRWAPDIVRLAQQLQDGHWGPLRAVVGTYNKGVLNNGSHLIDLLHRLLGPLDLLAAGPAVHDHWPDDPSVPALLRTASGVPVQLVTAHAADYALFELTLHMARASLTMEEGGLSWRVRHRVESPHFRGYHQLDSGERIAGEYLQSMRRAVDNLHAALLDEAPLASTGDTALAAQRLCERIRRAATSDGATARPFGQIAPFAALTPLTPVLTPVSLPVHPAPALAIPP